MLICFHSMPKMCCGFCHFASHSNYTYMILCAMDERSILYIYMQYCNRWFCGKRNMRRISLLARCVVDLMLVCHLNNWHVFHSLSFRCAFLCFHCFGLNTSYWHWNTVEYWLNKRLTCKVDWNWFGRKEALKSWIARLVLSVILASNLASFILLKTQAYQIVQFSFVL